MGSSPHVKQISFRHDRRGVLSWSLNIIWLLLGGWHLFLTWFTAGALLCLTCVGIPCGWQVIKISIFLLFPFGKQLTYTHDAIQDEGGRCCMRSCNCVLNIFWVVTVGWLLAIQSFLTGCIFMVTIIGIPFGWQCFKLTYLCLFPFGADFTAEEVSTILVSDQQPSDYQAMQV